LLRRQHGVVAPAGSFLHDDTPSQLLEPAAADVLLAQVQQRLAPDELLVHYFVADAQSYALLITHTTIRLTPALIPTTHVTRALNSWRLHTEHGYQQHDAATHRRITYKHLMHLYRSLVAPIAHELHTYDRLLLMVPPDWHDLPFAALFDGAQHVIEQVQIVYLTALDTLLMDRAPARSPLAANQHALVVGCSEQGRLPEVVVEAEHVAATLAPHLHTTCLLETAATVRAVQAFIGQSLLVHLAAHAVFRADNPFFSWIQLADQRLTMSELYAMTLPHHPLVVLSACETGRGQTRGGGVLGMGRALLAAGAAELLMSLWKIEDQATSALMADFYMQLRTTGGSAAAALCTAQRQAIARGDHPYHWAAFVAVRG
jgi:CHAT domain-containing protein